MAKKEKLSTEPYKGVRDFYPEDQALLNYLFATCRGVAERFGYVEYHASVLEPAELYKAKGSENEEIVNEQAYTFVDRGGREVMLRPEMTPSVARMVAARRRELGFPLRLFSIPNVFRYERPQRGRLREHWQLNVDLFGTRAHGADAEIIAVAAELMRAFGASEHDFIIKVNSREHLNELMGTLHIPEEKQGGFLYLLDRRAKMSAEEFAAELKTYGVSPEQLSSEVPADVEATLDLLAGMGVTNAEFDLGVVRGFSYYTGIVFEVFDTHPDNRRALFGGGRYDNLTALFDDEPVTGVGFGMGDVTIRDFLEVRGLTPTYLPPTKLYLALPDQAQTKEALVLAQELRAQGVTVALDWGDKKLGDQIKTATKHKILYLMVVGERELADGTFAVRDLATGHETPLQRAQLASFFLTTPQ